MMKQWMQSVSAPRLLALVTMALWIVSVPRVSAAQCTPGVPVNGYVIYQITCDPWPHQWPAINNNNDIVWSEIDQQTGLYKVVERPGSLSIPGPTCTATTCTSISDSAHDYRYPDISDSGAIVYLKDHSGGGAGLLG